MGGQCFSQCFLGGCSTRLPPCRSRTHGSEHPYCFCGSEVQCSLPSSCRPETYMLLPPCHRSLPCRNSCLFLSAHSPFSCCRVCCSGLVVFNLLSVFTHSETSDFFFCQTLLLLALPLLQSVSSLASLIQCLHFFFIPASSQSSKHLCSHADHLVMGSGSGSEPSIISTW